MNREMSHEDRIDLRNLKRMIETANKAVEKKEPDYQHPAFLLAVIKKTREATHIDQVRRGELSVIRDYYERWTGRAPYV